MLTLDFILKNSELFQNSMRKRGVSFSIDIFEKLETERKDLILQTQDLQEKKNKIAKEIGAKKAKGEDASVLLKEGDLIKATLPEFEEKLREKEEEIKNFLLTIPNILDDEVPEGKDEFDNIEVKMYGSKPDFDFTPKEHFDLLPEYLDFETASKISGSRFVILKDKLSRLERALVNFCLDANTKAGYSETSVPYLVKPHAFVGTGQLPKFEGDFFKTTDGYFLIPTAEVSLTNMLRETLVEEKNLPIRLTSATPCFRSEAGSAGRDTRGMIRQHQFTKVELVTICSPETAENEHQKMLKTAEYILQALGLCYRVVLLCGGDIGFGAKKTFDIEVWLAGQNAFREISSISNTGSFQAQRMNAKFKRAETKKNEFLHTLNGSSLAIGRLMVAILENYQTKDGRVKVPEALKEYLPFDII
jgi:seryl-tRNA synthetase